jgi:methylated-DNA-[protein]-cysteine S-methyltransferase
MGAGFTTFPTSVGQCGVAWSDAGITRVYLPEGTTDQLHAQLERELAPAVSATPRPAVQEAIARMTSLLDGQPDDLRDIEIDVADRSEFARRVWDLTRLVAPGQTTTYGEIAHQLGTPNAAREVGQALGHNPVPIIVPCHRVLGAGGRLVGFSAPGGVETKLRMLGIEGAAAPDGQTALF